ncbi:hypothetical protein A2U01_0065396, partial [Trifolium medium]|nr:hypothetical protein [Trifolium medium]
VRVKDDIRASSSPNYCCFLLVGRQGSVCEVIVHGGHPTVCISNGVYVEDPGGLLNGWSR